MKKGKKILIVDDYDGIRDNIKIFLERRGHQVFEAQTGEIAIEEYTKKQPDLVIMDYDLGQGINGVQSMEKILEINSKAKIVGHSSSNVEDSFIKSGAFAYINKGCSSFDKIEEVLKNLT